jgi:hypothetical protein
VIKLGRNRRIICGFLGGVLIRLSFDVPTLLSKVACITTSAALIIFGLISDKKLAKLRADRQKEWWEKYLN